MVICLGQGADLHMAHQLVPLPLTISCSSKSRLVSPSWFPGYVFLVLAHPGSPGHSPGGHKTVVVVVVVVIKMKIRFLTTHFL